MPERSPGRAVGLDAVRMALTASCKRRGAGGTDTGRAAHALTRARASFLGALVACRPADRDGSRRG